MARLDIWLSLELSDNPEKIAAELKESEQNLTDLILGLVGEAGELPIQSIQDGFGLSREEMDFFMCCLAPSLDEKYLKIFSEINLTGRPDVSGATLAKVFRTKGKNWRSFCSGKNRLIEFDLLYRDPSPEYNASELIRPLRAHQRLVSFVQGEIDPQPEAGDYLILQKFAPEAGSELEYDLDTQNALKYLGLLLENSRSQVLLQFTGADGTGKSFAALGLCNQAGRNVIRIDIRRILSRPEHIEGMLRRITRESLLLQSAILIPDWHLLKEQEFFAAELFLERLQSISMAVILTSELPFFLPRKKLPVIEVFFEPSDYSKRMLAWHNLLSESLATANGPDLEKIAGLYKFNEGQIENIVSRTRNRSIALKGNAEITSAELLAGCREESSQKLSELAVKVNTKHSWDALILPEEQTNQLQQICNHMQFRAKVYEEWGYESRVSAVGLNALFSGPPGTGKTLAASVIARELGLDLYKIDLSTVVSKYIGETEKNLSRIFSEAEASNAILFFDEADSLFGKRSAVRDAHDRYANIQVGYLLQKMEEFPGMTILASNLIENMDDAFLRRLHFSIDFPLPGLEERERIWKISFPEEAPLGEDVTFSVLAKKLKVPGGNIRNIALHAAFHAAAEDSNIKMEHIQKAAQQEYEKEGRSLSS